MLKLYYIPYVTIGLLFLPSASWATIVELRCEAVLGAPSSPDWYFDFETGTLALTEARDVVPSDPFYWGYQDAVRVVGHLDSLTTDTFTIVRHITNTSTVPWTGFVVLFSPAHGTDASLVDGSLYTSSFSDVAGYGPGEIALELYGGVVTPGETLTVQFDVYVDAQHSSGGFSVMVGGNPVPEPSSILILACGAAALLPRHWRHTTGARK